MTPGIYSGIPFADYLAIKAVNSSALRLARKSMAHVKAALDGKIGVETRATDFGRLVHTLTLEPATFENLYVVDPGAEAFRTAEGKVSKNYRNTTAFSEWAKTQAGREIVSPDDLQRARNAAAAVAANERARELLSTGLESAESEVTVVWDDDGVLCKARVDRLGRCIADLKTTADASEFERSIGKYDYGIQAAFYQRGVKAATGEDLDFAIVAVESEEPHGVKAAPLSRFELAPLHDVVSRYLTDVRRCQLSDTWPGYESPDSWVIPAWSQERAAEAAL
jgi:hypothetical protein